MTIIIRSKTFEEWFKANFDKSEMEDIANHGADSGFHHLTYYRDTSHIYDTFEDEIWLTLVDDADDYGAANVYEFLSGFNKDYMPSDAVTMKNQLVWYMAERYARELTDW